MWSTDIRYLTPRSTWSLQLQCTCQSNLQFAVSAASLLWVKFVRMQRRDFRKAVLKKLLKWDVDLASSSAEVRPVFANFMLLRECVRTLVRDEGLC